MIGDIARGKQQCCFLAVQARQLGLELDVIVRGPGNVAGASGTCTDPIDRLVHGRKHVWMLAHAQVIVGTPHRDVAHSTIVVEMLRRREAPPDAPNISKDAVAAFLLEGAQRLFKFL
jgi:hypothetical protein